MCEQCQRDRFRETEMAALAATLRRRATRCDGIAKEAQAAQRTRHRSSPRLVRWTVALAGFFLFSLGLWAWSGHVDDPLWWNLGVCAWLVYAGLLLEALYEQNR